MDIIIVGAERRGLDFASFSYDINSTYLLFYG